MLNHGPRDSKDSENLEVLLGEGPAALAGRDDNLSGNTGDGTRVGGGQTCGQCHRAQPAVIGTMDIGDAKGNQEVGDKELPLLCKRRSILDTVHRMRHASRCEGHTTSVMIFKKGRYSAWAL